MKGESRHRAHRPPSLSKETAKSTGWSISRVIAAHIAFDVNYLGRRVIGVASGEMGSC
jgi:hypothetical protein